MLLISYFTIFSKVGSLVVKKIRLAFYAACRCTQWRYSACCPQSWVVCKSHLHFYTPVWKTGRIMPWQCPSVRLSVCPSVRPSVRPRFPDFSSTCFEISIWNLVYTFSRWHDMSSLSCITIGSFWPSLQLKVGQTHFLQSWPHKSR